METKRYWLRLDEIGGYESMVRAADYDQLRAELDASKFCANVADDLRAELAKLEFELEVAKTDELSAAVWAATETIKHDLWDAQAELITLKADLARYETTAENCDRLRAELAELMAFNDAPISCDYCGVETTDPWHGSGEMLMGKESKHIHACDNCRGRLPIFSAPAPSAVVIPERFPESAATDDRMDVGYTEGWNSCIDEVARLNPAPAKADVVPVPVAIARRMATDAAQYDHEHAIINDNVQLWQQPNARLSLTVGDLRVVRDLLAASQAAKGAKL